MTARLATNIWVSALLRRADAAGVAGVVARRGDPVAGAIILVARARDGRLAAWSRAQTGAEATWTVALETAADGESRLDEYLSRQARYDPDLWIIELATGEIEPFIA